MEIEIVTFVVKGRYSEEKYTMQVKILLHKYEILQHIQMKIRKIYDTNNNTQCKWKNIYNTNEKHVYTLQIHKLCII